MTTTRIALALALAMSVACAPAATADVVTVGGRDYPACAVEDCSDKPGQVGVWTSPRTGLSWLSVGEYSIPVSK